jgi:hypothetical protein
VKIIHLLPEQAGFTTEVVTLERIDPLSRDVGMLCPILHCVRTVVTFTGDLPTGRCFDERLLVEYSLDDVNMSMVT